MEGCPPEDDVAAFVRGELPRERSEAIEAHLDGCQACSMVVAELVRIFNPSGEGSGSIELASNLVSETERSSPSSLEDEVPALPAGAEVGRYKVLECIGIGGMGVVYGAYDPELDRKVALKLLRRGLAGDQERRNARLRREAQAMAKLADPNVIAVHDVGLFEGRVFIAMEFVEGTTLGKWMRERPRTFKEIHAVFSGAAAGLAAAHEAGLVHRDFKPDNVLIGYDGRVRVTDFGLASFKDGGSPDETDGGTGDAEDNTTGGSGPVLDVQTLTRTGMLVGTPAYMSPEAYSGRRVTALSDQFSFCVALYEALYGERPFEGKTIAELANNVTSGAVRPVRDANVPSRVRELVRRGMSVEPNDRFPSMRALLAVFNRRPSRTARRWAMVIVPTALLLAGLWWDSPGANAGVAFCRPEYAMEAVWSEQRKATIREAFAATSLAWAPTTAETVAVQLDAYAERWNQVREEVCSAGEGADVLPGQEVLKSHCLLRQRARLDSLLEVFEAVDEVAAQRALAAVESLPDPSRCAEEQTINANVVPEPPAEVADLVGQFRQQLERAYAKGTAGRHKEALVLSKEVDDAAEGLGYPPLHAEAHLQVGRFQAKLGLLQEARKTLEDTAWIGVEAHHRKIAAQAWIELVFVEAAQLGDYQAAHRALRAAEAEVGALGDDPWLRERLSVHAATLAIAEGRNEDAMSLLKTVLSAYERDEGSMRRVDVLFNIAGVEAATDRLEDAEQHFREYIDAYVERYGEVHPGVAAGHFNLATTLYRQERLAEALVEFKTTAKIEEASVDANHPRRGDTMGAIAQVLKALDRPEEALPYAEQSVELASQPGGSPSQAAYHGNGLAEVLIALERYDAAAGVLAVAKRNLDELRDPDHPHFPRWHGAMSAVARASREWATAREHAEKALETELRQASPDALMVSTAHLDIAEIAIEQGDTAGARAAAQAVLEVTGVKPDIRAKATDLLKKL